MDSGDDIHIMILLNLVFLTISPMFTKFGINFVPWESTPTPYLFIGFKRLKQYRGSCEFGAKLMLMKLGP
jgi:hypothetical protein